MTDKRPDPKPRKHPQLWQSYLWWDELVQMRKRHLLRISSIEAGKSNLDAQLERDIMEHMQCDALIKLAKKQMVNYGIAVGEIWDWLTDIRGLKEGGLAAQLLAQIDDVGKFDTVSKLWRFAGWAVIDGQIDRCKKGEKSPYNRRLKSICWLVVYQFILQQTPVYVDMYYAEKERQRRLHPEKIKVDGKWKYNDGHLDNRARRKVAKVFLQHLWIQWREAEGLPISEPYVQAVMGHTNIITPPSSSPDTTTPRRQR
jgi:hypothetical protein